MELRRLEVENIRSFVHGRLDLSSGTTLLVGDVGAGKTSLLYAVEMALFGVAEVDAAFLVRHGTAHAEVAVTLEDDRHAYTIRRRFRKVRRRGRETYEPERLTFAEDGHPTAYSATEIRQRVIDLLGFPDNPNPHAHSDLWRWAIYVPQERMREILAADPEDRLETVRKALGVERYRVAAENAQAVGGDLRLSARRRRDEAARLAHWDTEFAEASRESDRLRLERATLAEALGGEDKALAEARERRTRAEQELARIEADRREAESLRREDDGEARRLLEIGKRLEALEAESSIDRLEADRLGATVADRPRLRAARSTAQLAVRSGREELERHAASLRELAAATAAREAAERRVAETDARLRDTGTGRAEAARRSHELVEQPPLREPPCPTRRSLGELEASLRSAQEAEHTAVELLARAKARQDQVTDLLAAGVCPTCGQAVRADQYSTHRVEADRAADGAETERAERTAARERLEEERKARERYERAHERWDELERRRQEAREDLARAERQLVAANEANAAALRERDGATERLRALEPARVEEAKEREALVHAEQALAEAVAEDDRAAAAEERLRALEAVAGRRSSERLRLEADRTEGQRRREERRGRVATLEASLNRGETIARQVEAARSAEATQGQRLAGARETLVRTDTRLDALVERLALAERGRSERAALVAEATDLEAKADWVGEPFRLSVLRMEKEILAHAQATFDRAFSRFFASLIDDPALLARTDVSFTPEVLIGGEPTPAEALSGGERTSLALAFRLALASVVRTLGTVRLESLLLDEPTDGFSSEQVIRMGELLEELALPQVVLVSHENELTGVADRTVRVVKADGRSVLEPDGVASALSREARSPSETDASPGPARPSHLRTR